MEDTEIVEETRITDTYYVKNVDLIPEIEDYAETGVMSERLGGMLYLIAKNVANNGRFINYTWREDMIQEALLTLCRYLKNFDSTKSRNPFGYITKICWHSYFNYNNNQRKHSGIKDDCYNHKDIILDEELLSHSTRAIDYTVMAKKRKKRKKKDQSSN